MAESSAPSAPKGLGLRGRRLWRAAWRVWEFNVLETTLLEQACRVADTIDALIAAMEAVPNVVVEGSKGQPRPHPLLKEVREERALLKNLLMALGIPDDDPTSWDGLSASERGRRAALARWRKGGR